jgi:hypothetical protein
MMHLLWLLSSLATLAMAQQQRSPPCVPLTAGWGDPGQPGLDRLARAALRTSKAVPGAHSRLSETTSFGALAAGLPTSRSRRAPLSGSRYSRVRAPAASPSSRPFTCACARGPSTGQEAECPHRIAIPVGGTPVQSVLGSGTTGTFTVPFRAGARHHRQRALKY